MFSITRTLLVALILGCFANLGESKKKRKLVVNYKSGVTLCDAESAEFVDPSGLTTSRYNESIAVLNGTFQFKKKIDGNIKLTVVAEKILQTGNKERISSYEISDFCEELKNRKKYSRIGDYLNAVDYPPECPIEPGTYTSVNMVANLKDIPISYMQEGAYTMTITMFSYDITEPGSMAKTPQLSQLWCIYFDISIDQAN